MEPADRTLRAFVYERFLATTNPPTVEEAARALDLSPPDVAASLRRLDVARHLKLIERTSRILMAFPFSAIATSFRVTRSNGRRYFANCAWDAVAFHPMLDEPIRVDSFCAHCAQPLEFWVEQGDGVPGATPVPLVHLGLPASRWWRDIVRTCSNTMVFVASQDHLDQWKANGGPADGRALSVAQMVELSVPIYRGRLDMGYDRPSAEAIGASFRRLGLQDAYWDF